MGVALIRFRSLWNFCFCLDLPFSVSLHWARTLRDSNVEKFSGVRRRDRFIEGRALATNAWHSTQVRFRKRFVDDTCTALPRSWCQELLEHLDSIEATFTLEVESEGKLPFLDVFLQHHGNGSISTSEIRKPTHTDKYLDFTSHHPWACKAAVVHTL